MKTKCMSCGSSMKKMAVGGTTTKRIIKKSTGGMYGIPQENLGTSGQYGFAKKGGVVKSKMKMEGTTKKKFDNGGLTGKQNRLARQEKRVYNKYTAAKTSGNTEKSGKLYDKLMDKQTKSIKAGVNVQYKTGGAAKPLIEAQKGKIVKTSTPFQNYMKTPGAIASDTTQSFTGSRDGSKPVLDKAYYDTYYAGKENERRTGNDKVKYDANGKRVYKKGGTTKAAKFAALAPPYDKATFADRIVGAKKSSGSKKLPKAQFGAFIKAFSKVVKPVAKAVKKAKPKTVDFRTAQTKDLVKNAFQNIERNSMKQKLQEIEKIRKLKYPNGDPVYKSFKKKK